MANKNGRPPGRHGIKTMLAEYDFQRLGINPLEETLKAIDELNEIKDLALESFKKMRGYSQDSDSGTQYIATAARCVTEKASIYMKLAKFRYPELSAVAIRDIGSDKPEREPLTTQQAIDVIKSDPFSPQRIKDIPTEQIMDAINSQIDTPSLPFGKDK